MAPEQKGDTLADIVEVENVNHPGKTTRVNAAKYYAMRTAALSALPATAPGKTFDEAIAAIRPILPQDLFPGGATAGWWFKTVQLDLEAKNMIKRSMTSPLRWYRTKGTP